MHLRYTSLRIIHINLRQLKTLHACLRKRHVHPRRNATGARIGWHSQFSNKLLGELFLMGGFNQVQGHVLFKNQGSSGK